jgi:hypothetical protein
MCLSVISRIDVPNSKIEVGYKLFRKDHTSLRKGLRIGFPFRLNHPVEFDTWVKAVPVRLCVSYPPSETNCYTSGFHFFPAKGDAEAYRNGLSYPKDHVILPVRVRGVETQGFDRGIHTWVAQELYIPMPKLLYWKAWFKQLYNRFTAANGL